MTFLFGYAIGSVVTVFLIYKVGKKKKAEADKLVSNAQSLNKQNSEEGDEDEL